jgi:hypothetical protein
MMGHPVPPEQCPVLREAPADRCPQAQILLAGLGEPGMAQLGSEGLWPHGEFGQVL